MGGVVIIGGGDLEFIWDQNVEYDESSWLIKGDLGPFEIGR